MSRTYRSLLIPKNKVGEADLKWPGPVAGFTGPFQHTP